MCSTLCFPYFWASSSFSPLFCTLLATAYIQLHLQIFSNKSCLQGVKGLWPCTAIGPIPFFTSCLNYGQTSSFFSSSGALLTRSHDLMKQKDFMVFSVLV